MSPPRRLLACLPALLLACNESGLVDATDPADPRPSGTPEVPPTPVPTETPEPCQFYAVDATSDLWRIDPTIASATWVGSTGVSQLTDLAVLPDGTMLGITFTDLYAVSPGTAQATLLAAAAFSYGHNAADALPDGRLLIGGASVLATLEVASVSYGTVVTIPSPYGLSGDIALRDATTGYATLRPPTPGEPDRLWRFDLASGTAVDVGSAGAPQVYGLDYGCDGRLYGLSNSPPRLLRLDPDTGAIEDLGALSGPTTLWGASGPASP